MADFGGPKKKSGKKKKSFWGRVSEAATRNPVTRVVGKTGKGFYEIGTGLPTGLYEAGRVSIQRGEEPYYEALLKGKRPSLRKQFSKEQRAMGRTIAKGTYTDLRHPLRNPASTLLTLGSVAAAPFSGGASLGVKGTAAISAAKAGGLRKGLKAGAKTKRKPPTRKFKGFESTETVSKKYAVPGKKTQTQTTTKKVPAKEYVVHASNNPLFRALRAATLDPAFKASRKRAIAGKRGGGYARQRVRRTEAEQARFTKQSKGEEPKPREITKAEEVIRGPMNLVRLRMLLNPRYYLQNIGGTAQMLAVGGGSGKAVAAAKQMRKKDPALFKRAQTTEGTGGMATLGLEAGAKGGLSKAVQKAMEKANIPESMMRPVALIKAAMDEGIDTPAKFRKMLNDPESQLSQRIMKRGNERVVDYARLGDAERRLIASQLPIFYAMTKGFTRYTARFPGEYPIKAGVAGQIGKEGKKRQKAAFGRLPWYAPYLIPLKGGKKAVNPGPLYSFQPGLDVGAQAAQPFLKGPQEGMTLLQHLGPGGELAYSFLTGKDPATGWGLPGTTGKKPSLNWAGAALAEQARRLGGGSLTQALGKQRESKTYEPISLKRQLALEAFGTGLVARKVKKTARKKWQKGQKKKKKSSGGSIASS
jgi:hypothetical protein